MKKKTSAQPELESFEPGDEIITVPALADGELQCIDCVRQALMMFYPDPDQAQQRHRVMKYCAERFGGFPAFAGPASLLPPNFARDLGKNLREVQREMERDPLLDPDPETEEGDDTPGKKS